MDDEEYICPQGWRWSSIYNTLHHAYKESLGATPDISEPPHLLPANASDAARKHRWEETLQWAEDNGFSDLIPELPEDERYYHASYN